MSWVNSVLQLTYAILLYKAETSKFDTVSRSIMKSQKKSVLWEKLSQIIFHLLNAPPPSIPNLSGNLQPPPSSNGLFRSKNQAIIIHACLSSALIFLSLLNFNYTDTWRSKSYRHLSFLHKKNMQILLWQFPCRKEHNYMMTANFLQLLVSWHN
jgi:hypothetical protein